MAATLEDALAIMPEWERREDDLQGQGGETMELLQEAQTLLVSLRSNHQEV